MAQGCAIISTDRGGPSELITDSTGILIDPVNQEAWQEKITYFLDHPVLRKKMAQAGQEFVQDFKWDLLAPRIVKVYQS